MVPGPEPARGIDHLVLAVRELDAARTAFTRMGFTLTPPARHPFGTANTLVQLHGSFLELLAVAEPAAVPPHARDRFSFAAFNRDFLTRRQGMSMLAFDSADADADAAEFHAKRLSDDAPFHFERTARLPDGGEAVVGFSLAFVARADMPEAVFFTCQQHAPGHFWKPAYQRHANGAAAVAEVTMVAADPARLAPFFAAMLGRSRVRRRGDRMTVATARGRVVVVTPAAFAGRFPGLARPAARTPRFAGFRLAVADLGRAAAELTAGGVTFRRRRRSLWIADALGTVVEFGED